MTTSGNRTASSLPRSSSASRLRWIAILWLAILAVALTHIVQTGYAELRWVSELSVQGSPPPAADPNSPTGYVHGQRHFLGAQERGETYRWIAAAQDFIARGPLARTHYEADPIPTGRSSLLPRLYTAWVCTVAWGLHVVTGESLPLSVERAALWEPLISHVLAFAAAAWWFGRQYGLAGAAVAGVLFAFFPPLSAQFLPGVLTARTWALLLAAAALAMNFSRRGSDVPSPALRVGSAVAAAAALWLDPAFGFPAILISAATGATAILAPNPTLPCMRWALVGSALTLAGWLIDRAPWDPAAGELRYIHPLYALAWLGLGLALDGAQHLRAHTARRKLRLLEVAASVPLIGALAYVQLSHGFKAWLYPSVWIRRLASFDSSFPFDTVFGWTARASFAEVLLLSIPVLAAAVMLALAMRQSPRSALTWLVVFTAIIVFASFRLRWCIVAALVSVPLLCELAKRDLTPRRWILGGSAATFLAALVIWQLTDPASFRHPAADREPSVTDLQALVHRHFAHWLAAHTPAQQIAALAPPELADSLVFHAGGRTLMSTAWESYPGQLAATRILSALEDTEAEAVLDAHGVTHVILPSWDNVLPLFVRKPEGDNRQPLFERLQRWLHPSYLRPLPYRLPPIPLSADGNLVVFKVTPSEDEALSLSRLAEYFVEMDRAEPAALAAGVLAKSFPDDPNAAIARATFHAFAKSPSALDRELDRLTADIAADRAPFYWDRRVQRAIVLALGRRHELARQEVTACLASATRDDLYELTPLQSYRLESLARRFRATFPTPELAGILETLGAELSPASPRR